MSIISNCHLGALQLGATELLTLTAAIIFALSMVVAVGISLVVAIRSKSGPKSSEPAPAPSPTYSTTVRLCPKCGKTLEPDAPQGLCPACLMKAAFTTAPGSSAGTGDTQPPTPADLAADFPQLEILELLGQGGMGMVYKARQSQLDRFVALKILPKRDSNDPAFEERFAREARALAKLNHPNIVGVHDFGKNARYYFFIMEYVDGVNLRQMEQTQRLTPEQAIEIIPKICDALQYAHEEGIVHRDIKPGNILIDKKGRVKIADFGLAKLLDKKDGEAHLTQSNVVMGTPHYMAPEQVNNPLTVDHRADIYSLGVVFYEMLTGELPLGRFAPPSQKVQVDVRLDEVVLRTLESEPARRYQQVSEVRTDVENITGLMQRLPPEMRYAMGGEYRSETTIGSWPLVHIAWGTDASTGKKRVAKGVLAIGDVAKGVFAFGGIASGVFAFGGVALGFLAVGGVGIGLISFAGLALGLLFAYGGLAVSAIAIGGMAAGYYTAGGLSFGKYQYGGGHYDNQAAELFSRLMGPWLTWLMMILVLPSFIVPIMANAFARGQIARKLEAPRKPSEDAAVKKLALPSAALLLVVAVQWFLLIITGVAMTFYYAQRRMQYGFVQLTPMESFEQHFQIPVIVVAAVGSLVLFATSTFIAWGAIKMRRAESYGFALTASIMTLLTSPANLLGFVAGLWALVVLLQSDVRKAFRS